MAGSQHSGPGDGRNDGRNGPGYHYEYNYNYNFNSPSPPRKGGGWGEWIGIIVLFLIPLGITQVIAVIWAVTKILKMTRQEKQSYYRQYRQTAERFRQEAEQFFRGSQGQNFGQNFNQGFNQNFNQSSQQDFSQGSQQAWAQPGPTADPQQASAPGEAPQGQPEGQKAAGKKKSASSKTYKAKAKASAWRKRVDEDKGSTGLIIAGAIVAGVFGLGAVSILLEFFESLSYGFFFADELTGALAAAAFFAGGLAMLLCGIGGRQRQERYLNYLFYIGTNQEVGLAHMAATFGVSVKKLCKDLRRMLSKGILPTGYLDLAEGKLYLTDEGYRARAAQSAGEEPDQAAGAGRQEAQRQESAILREIRQINDAIPDEAMSAKISRIEEITAKILDYQQAHPDREGKLRPFLNYYLPTTLKILRAYAQLEAQGVEGENISAATARIEGMMDQVVAGFEKQLDKLFQDDAMDITSDVQVLENMLKKDGLSGDQMTMEL